MIHDKSEIVSVIRAPKINPSGIESAGDVLLQFYRALGWNGDDIVDSRRVRTSKFVYNELLSAMKENCSVPESIGAAMVGIGPGVDDEITGAEVYLLKGWITPDTNI